MSLYVRRADPGAAQAPVRLADHPLHFRPTSRSHPLRPRPIRDNARAEPSRQLVDALIPARRRTDDRFEPHRLEAIFYQCGTCIDGQPVSTPIIRSQLNPEHGSRGIIGQTQTGATAKSLRYAVEYTQLEIASRRLTLPRSEKLEQL